MSSRRKSSRQPVVNPLSRPKGVTQWPPPPPSLESWTTDAPVGFICDAATDDDNTTVPCLPLHIDIGSNRGRFASVLKLVSPHYRYIGVDVNCTQCIDANDHVRLIGKGDLVWPRDQWSPAHVAAWDSDDGEELRRQVSRDVYFMNSNAEFIGDIHSSLKQAEAARGRMLGQIACVTMLHPDPWPKLRQAKRRLVNPRLLKVLHETMACNETPGIIVLRTDHLMVVKQTVEQFDMVLEGFFAPAVDYWSESARKVVIDDVSLNDIDHTGSYGPARVAAKSAVHSLINGRTRNAIVNATPLPQPLSLKQEAHLTAIASVPSEREAGLDGVSNVPYGDKYRLYTVVWTTCGKPRDGIIVRKDDTLSDNERDAADDEGDTIQSRKRMKQDDGDVSTMK